MTITTPDDLLRLAPDAKTLEAGRRLFYSRRWQLVGGDGQWLWGAFPYGNSGKASETAVELTTGRYVCNCRGRTRPCAHGLALVLMLKNAQDRITVGQPPSWLRSVQFRTERKEKLPAVQNSSAASQRQQARLELMSDGVEELEIRLIDIARRGIADTLAQGPDPFLRTAARLVDAKLPGPAGRLRRLAALGPEGTEAEIARILGDLYLFIRAWKHRQELPSDHQEELLQYAGMTTRKEDILGRPGLEDHWLVMGVSEGTDDKLRFRRVWLRGETSRRFALILDYAFREQAYERTWPLAASFQGQIHYYPGSYPQRGLFPEPIPGGRPYDGLKGYDSFVALRENYRKALAVNPWLLSYPVYLQAVRPIKHNGLPVLVDDSGDFLPLSDTESSTYYTLLAVSGGGPLKLFGEFDGYQIKPLSLNTGSGLVEA